MHTPTLMLTPEQQSKLHQFKEIVAYPENEEQLVMDLLEATEWNMEAAIPRYLDKDFTPTPPRQPIASSSQFRYSPQPESSYPQFPPAAPIKNNWKLNAGINKTSSSASPILLVLMLLPKAILFLVNTILKLFGSDPNRVPSEPKNRESTVSSFLRQTLGEPFETPLFEGEFNEALQSCKTNLSWLVVVLVNSETSASQQFVKNVLNKPRFDGFVRENDVHLWVGNVVDHEAHEVARTYKVSSTPCVFLCANVSAFGETSPRMSLVKKTQSAGSSKKLMASLQAIVHHYEPQLIAQRTDMFEMESARSIRQQQEDAYLASLEKDKQKREAAREKETKLQQQLQKAEYKRKQKVLFLNDIREKWRDPSTPEKGSVTRIQFRNHQGLRIVHSFSGAHTLYDLYTFVESRLCNFSEEDLSNVSLDDYDHQFGFDLFSPMPSCKLEPSGQAIEEVELLWPNGNLMIEAIDESD